MASCCFAEWFVVILVCDGVQGDRELRHRHADTTRRLVVTVGVQILQQRAEDEWVVVDRDDFLIRLLFRSAESQKNQRPDKRARYQRVMLKVQEEVTYRESATQHPTEHWRLLVQQHAMDFELFIAADESQVGVEWVVVVATVVSALIQLLYCCRVAYALRPETSPWALLVDMLSRFSVVMLVWIELGGWDVLAEMSCPEVDVGVFQGLVEKLRVFIGCVFSGRSERQPEL